MYATAKVQNKTTEVIQWCKTKSQALRKSQSEIAENTFKVYYKNEQPFL